MSLRIVQQAVLDRLKNGPVTAVDGTLPVPPHQREDIEAAIDKLLEDRKVRIYGAPNANCFFGKDPEAFYLPHHEHLVER
ncbi:hypothetical protein [Novosphingobium sp. KA1]|uniref:hypothetical protein n=1 Tax=Novosphingobium sp. (strain KA1) TaxID=164608 RepID=UPI001A8F59D3|nr:hypothetical protein [Novosphingobium sp. KA1]